MLLSTSGLEIIPPRTAEMEHRVFSERISSGVARLDTMLDGGYLRGTCTRAGAAAGAANLAVLRRLRGADVAPKKARLPSIGPSLRRRK
jgi:hypothetical protein